MPGTRPVALVTGASRGIGRCAALALARRGHDVVVAARTVNEGDGRVDGVPLPGSLATTAGEIERLGARAVPVPLDLLDRRSVTGLLDRALAECGRIDVLVNNAIYQGPGAMARLADLELDEAQRMLTGNWLHQLLLVQSLLPHLLERGGVVVNLVSGSAYTDPPAPPGEGGWGVAYSAAKAAFGRLTGAIHAEYAGHGVRAYSVDPGYVVTERMRAHGGDTAINAYFRGAPPEVPGEVIGWLATASAAAEHAGQLVHAQRLCKELRLVPGWPPPREG